MNIITKLRQKIKSHAQQGKSDWELVAWSIAWEGYVTLVKFRNKQINVIRPIIEISNTEKHLLEKMQSFAKGYGRITGPYLNKLHTNNKPVYYWRICRLSEVKDVAENIVYIMPSKRKQEIAKLVLAFCNSRLAKVGSPYTDFEEMLWKNVAKLNYGSKRGKK